MEPLGIYQFAPDSRQLVIAEDIQTITLHVQRLYGFRSNTTHLYYTTVEGSAAAGQDFLAVPNGRLVFDSPHQTNSSFSLSILDDALSEPNEYFHVNLTHVQVLTPGFVWVNAPPRLSPQHSVATVTILASDATGGVLSIGPVQVQVPEDKDDATQQEHRVVLRVRRSNSVAEAVTVRVQAYGGLLFLIGSLFFSNYSFVTLVCLCHFSQREVQNLLPSLCNLLGLSQRWSRTSAWSPLWCLCGRVRKRQKLSSSSWTTQSQRGRKCSSSTSVIHREELRSLTVHNRGLDLMSRSPSLVYMSPVHKKSF